ncbi:MAG: hypothetical protein H0X08_08730 [Blastocatellia bacterium]|nr:hypothetical protein [Blastocatellia bacterium]
MFKSKLLPFSLFILLCCSGTQASPFSRWSVRGVVVNKTFRSTPLSHSLGVDGIYKLELRDEKNKVHRQMVTRTVFLAYEIGDAFDAESAPPTAMERKKRLAAVEAKEKAQAKMDDAPAPAVSEPKSRLIVAAFPQEMLPETEGF